MPVTTDAVPFDGEDAIQRQPKEARDAAAVEAFELAGNLGRRDHQGREPSSGGNRDNGSAFERGPVGKNRDLFADLLNACAIEPNQPW